jgi:plasmid stabilization system protein ParE
MKLRLLDVAELELDEAWVWHEAQVPGLGDRFLDEIRAGRDLIAAFPEAWHPLGDGVRRFRLKRFPMA